MACCPTTCNAEGSSLVYMVDRLIGRCGSGGFYLDDYERLLADMAADPKPKILLGVSYALWDLAERYAPKLCDYDRHGDRRHEGPPRELPKEEFHRILCEAFGVDRVHSRPRHGRTHVAGLLRRRRPFPHAGLDARRGARRQRPPSAACCPTSGAASIIDLANRFSCAFIQTQDVGRVSADGSFRIERTYRPQRHPGLQPVGTITVKIRMKVVAFVPIRLQQPARRRQKPPPARRRTAAVPHPAHAARSRGDRRGLRLLQRPGRAPLPARRRAVPARRSPRLDRNETLGREIYDAFTAEVVADVYLLAHATSPLHPPRDDRGGPAQGHRRGLRFGFQRRADADLRLVPGRAAQLCARRDSPCTQGDRTGLRRDQRVLHLPPRNMVRPASAHRPAPYVAVVDRIEGIDIDYPKISRWPR